MQEKMLGFVISETDPFLYFFLFRVDGRWSSEGMAVFGYSFWLVVLATACFVLNIVIIALTTADPKARKKVEVNNYWEREGSICFYVVIRDRNNIAKNTKNVRFLTITFSASYLSFN